MIPRVHRHAAYSDSCEIEEVLRAVNVVPPVLEVLFRARVLDFTQLKGQEEELRHTANNEEDDLEDDPDVRNVLLQWPSVASNVDVSNEGDDEADRVDH